MKKKLYVIQILIVVTLMLLFQWYFNRSPWETATFYSTDKAEAYIVFSAKLKMGHKILARLDLQEGAEDKGRLVLEMPNNEKVEWAQGYKQTQKQLELVTPADGLYKMTLYISPTESQDGKAMPHIKINWKFQ